MSHPRTDLIGGERLSAAVIVDHNPDGSVPLVSVRMSPLGAVPSHATGLRERLSKQLPDVFSSELKMGQRRE